MGYRIIGLFEYPRNSNDHHDHMGWYCHKLHPEAVLWSRIAAFAHEFSYDYSYLVHFVEELNAHCGWFSDTSYYVPFPVPTFIEWLNVLLFRESELKRILSSVSSADALFLKLKSKGETTEGFRIHALKKWGEWEWGQWHWPKHWGETGWNQPIPGGNFYYSSDDGEFQRLHQLLADTSAAISEYERCFPPDRCSAMTLCEVSQKKVSWIWTALRNARLHKSKIGEESITDFFVLELKKASKGTYFIDSFTRPQEKITGADWELWFTGPTKKWVGLRVQAKVISIDGKRYSQLHYKRKDGTYQIDQLVADAKKHKATPIYCLYSYWRATEAGKISWPCGTVKRKESLFGASILSVSNVQTLKSAKDDTLKSVAQHINPLHCVFCCQCYAQGDLPARAYRFLRARGYVDTDAQLLLDEPPYYVNQMMLGLTEGDLIDVQDENLGRVTIISEEDEERSNKANSADAKNRASD